MASPDSKLPNTLPRRSFWQTVRTAVVGSFVAAILGTIGISAYDTGEIQVLRQQFATTTVESRIDKDERRLDSIDKKLAVLQENIEHPHTHGVPCSCVGTIGHRQEKFQISLGADCDSKTIDDLRKTFPAFRCHPLEE